MAGNPSANVHLVEERKAHSQHIPGRPVRPFKCIESAYKGLTVVGQRPICSVRMATSGSGRSMAAR
jgi:hypothetical protein